MNWARAKHRYKPAIEDLCEYLRQKHTTSNIIYFRKHEIVIVGKEFERVGYEDVLDWLANKHRIHLNMETSVSGLGVRLDFYLTYIEGGILYKTPRKNDLASYEDVFMEACKIGVKAVNKRLK